MTRIELYQSIVVDIATRLREKDLIADNVLEDIKLEPLEFEDLLGVQCADIFKLFLDHIKQNTNEDEIRLGVNWGVNIRDFQTCHKDSLKTFVSLSSEAFVTTTIEIQNEISSRVVTNEMWSLLERMFAITITNQQDTIVLWECLTSADVDRYIVLANVNIPEEHIWRMYSYGVLWYINEKELSVPVELQFNSGTKFAENLIFSDKVAYEQYYEIYEVLQESKSSSDVLSRFLHMFQVMELMAFRVKLAKISKLNHKNSGFVHSVLSLTKDGGVKEKEIFLSTWPILFPNVNIALTDEEKQQYNEALVSLYDNYELGNNNDTASLSPIIYAIRNSIVHDKVCEAHFSFGNEYEYLDLVPLMRKIIKAFECAIIDAMQREKKNKLKYKSKTMKLY